MIVPAFSKKIHALFFRTKRRLLSRGIRYGGNSISRGDGDEEGKDFFNMSETKSAEKNPRQYRPKRTKPGSFNHGIPMNGTLGIRAPIRTA
jgi:hypothetical protein